ncbi:Cytospin-B, partial [Bienertia sinuspersici]
AAAREVLWRDLIDIANNSKLPWLVLGDFNNVLNFNKRVGAPVREKEIKVYSKIYRALGNILWLQSFENSEAHFLLEGEYDHSLIIVNLFQEEYSGKKPFKFYNMWCNAQEYQATVQRNWSMQLTSKLKTLKNELKAINSTVFRDVQAHDNKAYQELKATQAQCQIQPDDKEVIDKEKIVAAHYKTVHNKGQGSLVGHVNSHAFHLSIRSRRVHNRIHGIKGSCGNWVIRPEHISQAFLDFYQKLL